MAKREDFGRVRKWDRAFAGRVEGGEKVDEECDQAEVRLVVDRDIEAEASSKESPGHVGEGEQQQVATAERVNSPYGGECEQEVDQTEAEGRE